MSEANKDDLQITLDEIRRKIEADREEKRRKQRNENFEVLLLTFVFILGIIYWTR